MKYTLSFVLLVCSFAGFSQSFAPRYELIKLKEVNSVYHDAAPVVSPDGKKLYFFVVDHPANTFGKTGTQDIWMSTKDDKGVWSAPQHLSSPFNQSKANQVFQVLADGSLLVRGSRSKNDKGFSLVNAGGAWSELNVKDFSSMAKGRFNGAAISADLKHMILYFSEQENGIRSDLYISHEQSGAWSRPEKLKISTGNDEFAPFIGPDNTTLYFASDRLGQGRQGGTDIYKSTRLDDTWTNWSDPVNLGKPINTAAADSYVSMDAAGNVYTSRSNSRVDGGNLDIFILVPRTIKVMLVGTVMDEKTKQPIASSVSVTVKDVKPINLKTPATGKFETKIPETNEYQLSASASGYQPKDLTFSIPPLGNDTTLTVEVYLTPIAKKLMINGTVFNKKTNEPIASKVDFTLKPEKKSSYSVAAEKGKYELEIGKLGWYVLVASAEGFLSTTDSVWFNSEELSPLTKDLYLQPIEVGLTVRLKNIYFDFDKTTLKSESFVELNKVVEFLEQNPTVEIEISGHTDSKGADEYNLKLSQGRSQAVVDYVVKQGISSSRLTARGYGETKPIDTNDTEEGRANNRRVEFTVVKK
ncbi:MAG: OmpA family protein [Cyclobacteriaceae bacterium]|nr:OmpA family protein [Cyclobacteriaceae bacterium]